jgi:DNA invertase Pin-like site-specific DNA recombinase
LMQERTHAGLAVARARGKKGGRTPRHAEEPRVRIAYTMYVDQSLSVRDICRVLRIFPGHVLSLCGPRPTRRSDHVAS